MAQTRMAVILCDPHQPGMPIVFANRALRQLTGYDEAEVIGKGLEFLQGKDTDEGQIEQLREAMRNEDVIVIEMLNYRKDGTRFASAIHLGPIYTPDGEL